MKALSLVGQNTIAIYKRMLLILACYNIMKSLYRNIEKHLKDAEGFIRVYGHPSLLW